MWISNGSWTSSFEVRCFLIKASLVKLLHIAFNSWYISLGLVFIIIVVSNYLNLPTELTVVCSTLINGKNAYGSFKEGLKHKKA